MTGEARPAIPTDLTGRAAIVTGAGSGIGRGVAQVFATAGAAVVCADISAAAAEETAGLIRGEGGVAKAATVDVSRRDEVAGLVASAVAEHGRLDVICNNAGIIIDVPVLDLDEAEFDHVLAVNLKGVLFGCQEAGRAMAAAGGGSIINMASGAVDAAAPGLAAYGVSKAGIVQLTRTLAVELGQAGVRVNAIAPGLVETNITRRHYARPDGSVDEDRRAAVLRPMRERSPLGLIGTPEDIGWAALYLASDAARFVTGQILRPNGGVTMPW
ncbi:SDR family oxidoreductase [Frankia sp. CNm7]|uniref:SDR family oxidoreductase n=1 Tax=Frankia nepalensis TaxID=1836974 RepID=A0A937R8E6_9ACTN|nr:SDR family oxidoreductase [Frankia nepalensis]MBL7500151.1 SDR family oxidoreductase [Frankia nepalensis]MBL7512382.1 SDR family oxidoreductase [Frankia nepalensis]MBL7519573.1 SDR family oxidoreductase [Frankia nepalensis]MBL7625657.1 SDR family oxidoreductase [Frankia nepalensis]